MALQWEDKLNQALTIAGGNPGGIPNAPYDAPKEDPNKPWVPAPKRDKLAGGPYRMNKEGNAEVWEFGPKNYHYNPMPKSYYDLIKSVKGMNFKKAGASSRQIRDRLKPFTHGTGYDDVGGSLRGVPDALRLQLLRDAKA